MNRREFILGVSSTVAALSLPAEFSAKAGAQTTAANLVIHPNRRITQVPNDFVGLSYESAQLGNPNFFAASNKDLIALCRRLGTRGILRIGGNTSEFTDWTPSGDAGAQGEAPAAVGPDTGQHRIARTSITPFAIRNLAGFLEATGWTLIYGLNLGSGTPERDADEASYVVRTIGSRLLALQIGNEPDLYHQNHLRPSSYSFSDYYKEWKAIAAAIRAREPNAPLAGPDACWNIDWIQGFAEQEKHNVRFLSGHYYAEGPPTDPRMTIERLLSPSTSLAANVARIMNVSRSAGLPFRMTEGNSCYNGGKAGVSDTLAAALWGGDYMLQLTKAGYSSVILHGGGMGLYTPIAGSIESGFSARPIYYGMLLASQFAGATYVETEFDTQGVNATAYAAITEKGQLILAVFNKSSSPLRIKLDLPWSVRTVDHWRLAAPSVDSKTGVTLAGAPVAPNGTWSPQRTGTRVDQSDVPPYSAILVKFN